MTNNQIQALLEKEVDLPQKLLKIPSMQTLAEKKFLYNLASQYFSNQGLIFDSGLYLGFSTLCFGKGLQANANFDRNVWKTKPIKSFELGICTPGIAKKINELYPDLLQMREGDSFLPLLRRNIQDVSSLVQLYEGDITYWLPQTRDYTYEIVFLDVLKTPHINDCVIQKVFPHLIPNQTIVIQQDFITPSLPWIQISMGILKDYFEYLFTRTSSTVYLNTKPIPKELVNRRFYEDFTIDRMLELIDLSMPPDLSEAGRYKMGLAKSLALTQKVDLKSGIDFAEGLREQYNSLSGEKPWLKSVDQFIKFMTRISQP